MEPFDFPKLVTGVDLNFTHRSPNSDDAHSCRFISESATLHVEVTGQTGPSAR